MKHHLVILAVIIAHISHAQFSECINPFTKIGEKFYYIENHQKLNWFAAAVRCIQLGGQLATIENEKEMTQLSAHLLTQGYSSDWLWISGIGKTGSFLAIGNPSRILPYAKWGKNQPDDAGSNEDCIHIFRKDDEFLMNDRNCRAESKFICETKPPFNPAVIDVRGAFLQ